MLYSRLSKRNQITKSLIDRSDVGLEGGEDGEDRTEDRMDLRYNATMDRRKSLQSSMKSNKSDQHLKANIDALDQRPENQVTKIDKAYLIVVKQFLVVMVLVQIYQLLYNFKLGINQDENDCIVNSREDKKQPVFYKPPEEIEKLKKEPYNIDVTTKFEQVLRQNLVIYFLLDCSIAWIIIKYVKSIRDRSYIADYTYTFCFIVFFVFFGVVNLIMLMALRLSEPGKICSGDYLTSKDDKLYKDHADYFMTNEGLFVYIWVGYVTVTVILFLILLKCVNGQRFYRDQIDQAYIAPSVIQDHSRAALILMNQVKFQPEIKYPTIQDAYNIRDNYNMKEELGSGALGTTWLAAKIDYDANDSEDANEKKCVIKSIQKSNMDKNELPDKMLKQITLVQQLQKSKKLGSQYLAKIEAIIEDDQSFNIVYEIPNQEDFRVHNLTQMKDIDKLQEKQVVLIVHQLLKGLELLNKHGIIMNNLKPANVLLTSDKDYTISISDVGLQVLYEQQNIKNSSLQEKQWMAPELANNRSNPKSDVWTLGAIAYWLLTRKEPQNNSTLKQYDSESGQSLSKDCVDFVDQAMTVDLNQRPDVNQLLNHPWMKPLEEAMDN